MSPSTAFSRDRPLSDRLFIPEHGLDEISSNQHEDDLFRNDPPFRIIVESADFGVGVVNRDAKYIFSNRKWADMTGYSIDELYSIGIYGLTLPEDLERTRSLARDLFAGIVPSYTIEKRIRRKDGSTFWGRIVATPILDDTGTVIAINGLIADISTLKNALDQIELDVALHRLSARINTLLLNSEDTFSLLERFSHEMVTDSPFLHCAISVASDDPRCIASSLDAGPFISQKQLHVLLDEIRKTRSPSLSSMEVADGTSLQIAAVPVTRMDHFWGTLLLSLRDSTLLGPSALSRIDIFTQALSGVLESRSLMGINDALYRISRLIGSRPLPHRLFDETCQILLECGSFLDAAVLLYDPLTKSLIPEVIRGSIEQVGRVPKQIRFQLLPDHPDGHISLVQAFVTGKPVIDLDFSENIGKSGFRKLNRWSKRYRWKSGASFPLFGTRPDSPDSFPSPNGPVVGVLTVTSGESGVFHDRLVALLDEASRNLNLALSLHKEDEALRESQEKLSKITELYAALNRINHLVNQSPEEQFLLDETCRIINEIGMLYLVRILMVDKEGGLIRPVAVHARNESMVSYFRDLSYQTDSETSWKMRNLSLQACLSKNRPFIHHNLVKELEAMGLETLSVKAMEFALWSQGSFPICRGGEPRFIMSVFADRIGFFDGDLVSLLEKISVTISHALDNIDRDREKQQSNEFIRNSEEKYRLLMEEAGDGILIVDADSGTVIDANRQASLLFELDRRDLIGRSRESLLPESTRSRLRSQAPLFPSSPKEKGPPLSPSPSRFKLQIEGDSFRQVEIIESKINWRTKPLLQIRLRDVTDLHVYENELRQLAQIDALTGLMNRSALWSEMSQFIDNHRPGERHALFYVDLDNFKSINDTYGHETGDRLLVTIGQRIRAAVRENDFVARIGGDEFLIFAPVAISRSHCERIARRILTSLQDPFEIYGETFSISASFGISLFPDHATVIDELIRKADSAMYRSKRAGPNRFTFHEPLRS